MASQTEKLPTLTRFVAFYSYKGGVGRTLAMANCARALVARGKKVVLLDFDLEAPGLLHFDVFKPKNDGKRPAGFAEYLEACLEQGPPDDLDDYIHECQGKDTDEGKTWLMPAGRHGEPSYRAFLNKMNWNDFYTEQDGYKILENLRGHIIERYEPDYVFIDSRTGLSEIGGIATHQLADIVVLVFNLNGQNLKGAKLVFDSIRKAPLHPAVILVASPVPVMPMDNGTPFFKKMKSIKKDFSGAHNAEQPLVIPYHPLLAFEDRLLVDDGDLFSSDEPYRRLVETIQKVAEVDADYYLEQMTEPMRRGDWQWVKDIAQQGLGGNPTNINMLMNLASAYYFTGALERTIAVIDELLLHHANTAELPKQQLVAHALYSKGVVLGQLNRLEEEIVVYNELLRRFSESQVVSLLEQVANALFNKGFTLGRLQRSEEAIAAYDELLRRFGESQKLTLKGQVGNALINKSNILVRLQRPEEAIAGYEEVLRSFSASPEPDIQEKVANALNGKGFVLLLNGKKIRKNPAQRQSQLQTALTYFEQAFPHAAVEGRAIVLGNQGYALFLLGRTAESKQVLQEALALGGQKLYEAELADSHIDSLPEDEAFRILLERLWSEIGAQTAPKGGA
ncbi:MAG: KGGVGR-motif variant AAA ATPase [Methylobacter sp.]